MFRDNTHHQFKYLFGICLSVLYVDFSVKCFKFGQKWSLSYLLHILVAIFVKALGEGCLKAQGELF